MDEKAKEFIKTKLTHVYSFLELLSSLDDERTIEPLCLSTLALSYQLMLKEAMIAFVYDDEKDSASE